MISSRSGIALIEFALASGLLTLPVLAGRADSLTKVQDSRVVAQLAEGQALASSTAGAAGVLVRGIRAADLSKLVDAGGLSETLERFEQGKAVAIGRGLADLLALRAGDNITLVTSGAHTAAVGVTPRVSVYTVSVVLETGTPEYKSAVVFMASEEALKFLGR